jgi:hypothetical protein
VLSQKSLALTQKSKQTSTRFEVKQHEREFSHGLAFPFQVLFSGQQNRFVSDKTLGTHHSLSPKHRIGYSGRLVAHTKFRAIAKDLFLTPPRLYTKLEGSRLLGRIDQRLYL